MAKSMIERVDAIDRHRNGVSGAPFNVVIFKGNDSPHRKVAVVFDEPDHVAVFDLDLLAAGNIKFGENSCRGDNYEGGLRTVIEAHHARIIAELEKPFEPGVFEGEKSCW